MPQRSPRIPPNRHARSMGRTNITTTSRQTKRTRHQTKTTINLTNVGQPINLNPQTNPTHITKRRPQNLNRNLHTRRLTTRLQTTLTPQISQHPTQRLNRLINLQQSQTLSITQTIHKKQTHKSLKRNLTHQSQIHQTILNPTRHRNRHKNRIPINSTPRPKPHQHHQNPSQPKHPNTQK